MRKFQFEGKNNVSGDRIRELRLRARLSQAALAAKMQTEGAIIEQDAISRIENGSRLVTDYELLVLTRIFSVSADWLIGAKMVGLKLCCNIGKPGVATQFYFIGGTKMEVIGYRQSTFKTEDGKSIDGYNIYCTYPLDKGEGQGAERIYMTIDKLLNCGYSPAVGDEIVVNYNRYGKPASIELA